MSKELEFLLSYLQEAKKLSGGPLRARMGDLVENFVEYVWNNVASNYPNLQSTIIKELILLFQFMVPLKRV